MIRKRIATVALILALVLGFNAVRPTKAYAANEWVLAGIAIGIYAVFVIVATTLVFHTVAEDGSDPLQEAEREKRPVNVAHNCPPAADGNVALVCW